MAAYRVVDMTCGGCAASITRAIERADPNARVVVDLASKIVRVEAGAGNPAQIELAIRAAGFTPEAIDAC